MTDTDSVGVYGYEKFCRHPGGNLLQGGPERGDKVASMK